MGGGSSKSSSEVTVSKIHKVETFEAMPMQPSQQFQQNSQTQQSSMNNQQPNVFQQQQLQQIPSSQASQQVLQQFQPQDASVTKSNKQSEWQAKEDEKKLKRIQEEQMKKLMDPSSIQKQANDIQVYTSENSVHAQKSKANDLIDSQAAVMKQKQEKSIQQQQSQSQSQNTNNQQIPNQKSQQSNREQQALRENTNNIKVNNESLEQPRAENFKKVQMKPAQSVFQVNVGTIEYKQKKQNKDANSFSSGFGLNDHSDGFSLGYQEYGAVGAMSYQNGFAGLDTQNNHSNDKGDEIDLDELQRYIQSGVKPLH